MALNSQYYTSAVLDEYFVASNTGEALANGSVYFYQDTARTTPKDVFEIVQGSGPNYQYAALPNPMTLSAVGTFVDGSNNSVAVYYYPFDAFAAQQLYYIEVYDQYGNLQFTREAWPYPNGITSASSSGTVNFAAINSIAYYAAAGTTISGLSTSASSILATTAGGIPLWTQTLPSAVQVTVNSLGNGTNASATTYWNGAGLWEPITSTGTVIKILAQTAANTASIAFTGLTNTYTQYFVVLNAVLPITQSNLLIQVSTDNGATYKSAASDYYWSTGGLYDNGGAIGNINTADTSINITAGTGGATLVDTAAASGVCGQTYIIGAGSVGYCKFQSLINFLFFNSQFPAQFTGRGYYQAATTAVNAFKFLFSSGNIASGTFTLYGII